MSGGPKDNDSPKEDFRPQPIEIEDDYELALEAGVEDDTLLESPSDHRFSITSYGADYTVDTIVSRLKAGSFFVPSFQRQFVWSQRHASRFIESLLMGLPVPGIFLYKEPETNKHLVVDGQQRLRTLQFFLAEIFLEKKFRLQGVRREWDGKTYSQLDPAEQLKLDDSIVHATIFQQDEPKESRKSLYFVFERINSGGIRLSPQEIRNCINESPLLERIRRLNETTSWRSIFGAKKNARLKDQELILRFLALMQHHDSYSRPMRDFLNEFASRHADISATRLDRLSELFVQSTDLCWAAKGVKAFRPIRALNAAVYEGVMIGLAVRLGSSNQSPTAESVAVAYDTLLKDKSFLRACERSTADEETVKIRRSTSVAAFSSI